MSDETVISDWCVIHDDWADEYGTDGPTKCAYASGWGMDGECEFEERQWSPGWAEKPRVYRSSGVHTAAPSRESITRLASKFMDAVTSLKSAYEDLDEALTEYTEAWKEDDVEEAAWNEAVDFLSEMNGQGRGLDEDLDYVWEQANSFIILFRSAP